jgi:sigma-B regulation protein RsbU (phosphoserine phosphatase)
MNDPDLRVLVVDDDAVDREAVRRLLTGGGNGIRLEEAADATSALSAMQTGNFDAILLDYSLPARDGASILREAIDAGVTAPILVLTGHGDEQLAALLLRTGASDYIPKSTLKDADLPQRIRQVVRLSRAQQEAKRVQKSLQDRVEFEQQLIGVVSHDLRNPLSTIRLSAQVLRSKLKEESQRNVIERIIRATGQADRMIRDLLDFTQARLGAGIPIEPAQTDFHEVVRQVLGDLRIAHPDREVRLEQVGPGTGSWDAGRLAQMTMNLVGNAYQHSPAETSIQVVSAVDHREATLKVSNAGPAIPPDELPRLFEPLRRGRSLSSSSTGSIGLGLFISQAIAHAHGGEVDVISNERATTFTAHLPLSPPARRS